MAGQPATELKTGNAIIVLDQFTQPSNLVVDEDLEFSVAMEFTVTGISTALLGALTFEVLYTAESIGPEPEKVLGTASGKTIAGQASYGATGPAGSTTTRKVPPGTLKPGVYRLASVVTFKVGPIVNPIIWPVTGFTESPAIQVTP
jgi:hypothetical protein